MRLPISSITVDNSIQSRTQINSSIISDYAEHMRNSVVFPPLTVFSDGDTYWLADGFHRIQAAVEAEVTEVECEVREGTRRDAILYSVGANASHGLRRTNEDKRKSVMLLLQDDEWSQWSDREIAKQCAVGKTMVNDLRNKLCVRNGQIKQQERKVERNGTVYTQNTTNIGKPKTDFEVFCEDNHDKIHEVLKDNPVSVSMEELEDDWEEPLIGCPEMRQKFVQQIDIQEPSQVDVYLADEYSPDENNSKTMLELVGKLDGFCSPQEISQWKPEDILKLKMKLLQLKEKIVDLLYFINRN